MNVMRNWYDQILTFQKLLDCWRLNNLTLFSKVNSTQTKTISKLVFSIQMQSTMDILSKTIEKLVFKYIWGEVDKILCRSLICSMENERMNRIDLDSFILSLKAAWMNQFSCNRNWTYRPKYYLNKIAPCSLILRMNFKQI